MLTEVLILGIGRVKHNYSVVGMTTESDPITKLRWVRPLKQGLPLTRDDLHYEDGQPLRLGDVVQLDLVQPVPEAPFAENVQANWETGPPLFIRDLTEARRAAFFPKHLDPDPLAVLGRDKQRSVCLVRPDNVEAVFSFDEETERLEARLMPTLVVGEKRLRSEDGIPVYDPYWLKWGHSQLGDSEFVQIDHANLHELVGDMYLTLALNARKRVQIIGVHTVPNFTLTVDENTI